MAKKEEPAVESAYTEEFTAKVNEGGREVLLRGLDAHGNARGTNIVLHGKRGFSDGKRYRVTFTEIPEAEYAPKPSAEEVAAAKAVLDAAGTAEGTATNE